MIGDFVDVLTKACEEADKAAVASRSEHGNEPPAGGAEVWIPSTLRKLVQALKEGDFGSVHKNHKSGYDWNPKVTRGLGQSAHIYVAAAEAAVKVLKECGVEGVTVRRHYD